MTCSFADCGKPVFNKTLQLCTGHYQQKRAGRDLTPLIVRQARGTAPKVCTFPDCGRVHSGGGLCAGHYMQRREGKELTPLKVVRKSVGVPRDALPCEFIGCDNKQYAKGLCATHYHQQRLGQELRPLRTSEEAKAAREAKERAKEDRRIAKQAALQRAAKEVQRAAKKKPVDDEEDFAQRVQAMKDMF